ncbi:MAG TPA: RluA family pseudouridine synthase, partial [Bacillota bacterium]|nr:RluA family pseudouridine synthase [Bacillota bacterium]
EEDSHFEPEDIPISVVYEDDDLLIINKQPGYVVHPTKGHPCRTMANGIMNYMIKSGKHFKIRFVNRLDMDTSGLLAIAKNSHCQDDIQRQMYENGVTKKYVAVVHGIIDEEEGTIDLPVDKEEEDKAKRAVVAGGYPSVTHYKVLERFEKGYTMVELVLETGRTHQIRVHMSHIVRGGLYVAHRPAGAPRKVSVLPASGNRPFSGAGSAVARRHAGAP